MFKKLYAAGRAFTQTKLSRYVPGPDAPTEKAEAAGVLGVGLGHALQNMGLLGIGVTIVLAVATGVAAPAGLPLLALVGTGFAGIGAFGKGMKDAGEEASGVMQLARDIRSGVIKEMAHDIKARLSPVFRPGTKPATDSFAAAASPAPEEAKISSMTAGPAISSAPQASPLEMK